MKIIKRYLVIFLITMNPCLLFSSTQKENEAKINYVVEEYNKNIKDLNSLVLYISKKDNGKGSQLKEFFLNKNLSLKTKLPLLFVEKDQIIFTDNLNRKLSLMLLEKNLLRVTFNNQKRDIKLLMSVDEVSKSFEFLFSSPKSANLFELLIPNANAEGLGEVVGMGGSAIGIAVGFGVLGAMDSLGKILANIGEIPSSFSEKHTRDSATKACEDLNKGKPVKDTEKLILKLEKLKKKVQCVQFWESYMENSCGWFDERIACLSKGSVVVDDSTRGSAKPKTYDLSKPEKETNSISK